MEAGTGGWGVPGVPHLRIAKGLACLCHLFQLSAKNPQSTWDRRELQSRNLWGQCVRSADRDGLRSETQQDFTPSLAGVLELLRASSGHSNYSVWWVARRNRLRSAGFAGVSYLPINTSHS